MRYIAENATAKALELMNRFYADGKDMGALLDELACLTRDYMIIKTAPAEGISMLSGIASDSDVQEMAQRFSTGELIRMMNLIQNTISGFTRSASRRMDAELCIINLCQPELNADTQSLIARLTRVEEQFQTGTFVKQVSVQQIQEEKSITTELPNPVPEKVEIPPETAADEAPVGFWADVVAAVRSELNPALRGFFATSENAPLRGILAGDRLVLACANQFIMDIVSKPDISELVARKASAKLGRQVRVVISDNSGIDDKNSQMEQLLNFGRSHSDIIKINKE
jgi:hypothetical protein